MANEKRLIDANALLELVQFRLPIDSHNAEVIAGCVDITRRLVQNAPTVDAVEVCRCKDCEYCDKAFDNYWCNYNWNPYAIPNKPKRTVADGFCHNGERRTDG